MYTKQKTEHKRNRKKERRQQARRKRKNEPSEKEKLRPPKTTENYCQSLLPHTFGLLLSLSPREILFRLHASNDADQPQHLLFGDFIFIILALDAGKSTTGGQILFLSGQVDDRTIQKYEKEANDKSRESWRIVHITELVGIVKLMGHSSGFIAMQSSLASGQIDICLLPEVPFNLHGPHGVLSHLKYLIESKGSTVVCVAEGARQGLLGNMRMMLKS
ncbi:ATP-dependent 6-phosphofructokinase 5, chloroplastic [Trifolium repens]|nr:ATP-dependent 6-phosphofructokinase 5, chloroplastic [Trifolium repens]